MYNGWIVSQISKYNKILKVTFVKIWLGFLNNWKKIDIKWKKIGSECNVYWLNFKR